MIRVTIIGSGNVAQHLINAFDEAFDIELVQVLVRDKSSAINIVESDKLIDNYSHLKDTDVIIISVSDNAIAEVSSKIPKLNALVVHTSGSVAMSVNHKNKKGVFYPLQTFSKSKSLKFSTIPILIETENKNDFQLLEQVANAISINVQKANSEQRKALHVAAVFVCNFVNHLYQIGNEICDENNLSFDILKPLIDETANKVMELSPREAQTGPAKRKDTETINAHLEFLKDENLKEIYKVLTKSIIDDGKKL